jgi:transcriptional regulator with XRE-family HTH domain
MSNTRPDWEQGMKKISDLTEVMMESAPDLVRKYRIKRGFTRRNLAQLLDISERIVATWEDFGNPIFPTGKNLMKLIALFGPEFGQDLFTPLNLVVRRVEDDSFPTVEHLKNVYYRVQVDFQKELQKQQPKGEAHV